MVTERRFLIGVGALEWECRVADDGTIIEAVLNPHCLPAERIGKIEFDVVAGVKASLLKGEKK